MDFKRMYQQLKNVYHYFQAHLWRLKYGMPDKGMHIYAITGTNGKTTTSHLLGHILREEYGKDKVGMLTTIAFWLGEEEIINTTKMTTTGSKVVYRYLRKMKDNGVKHVVLEITSHALDQHRLAGLRFDGGIVLNLAREHLDYHKTMEEYARAKERIVNYLNPGAPLIGKADDTYVQKMLERAKKKNIPVGEFTTEEAQTVETFLIGEVNKENVLAASLLAKKIGIESDIIKRGVSNVKKVPGRMEWIEGKNGVKVIIDYAVTPDALERLYAYVKEDAAGKVIGVLGACGLRDRGKRPDMAKAVAKYADKVMLTREDPWTEDEEQIFQDLEKGLTEEDTHCERILDRKEAIRKALELAESGDIVVVTGKGAERGMAIGEKVIPWNDKKVIEELLL